MDKYVMISNESTRKFLNFAGEIAQMLLSAFGFIIFVAIAIYSFVVYSHPNGNMTFIDYVQIAEVIGVIWLCVMLFGCAILSAIVAGSKGRSVSVWFFLGLFFNILGLIAIAGMPIRDSD
jgi:hypothetical protein